MFSVVIQYHVQVWVMYTEDYRIVYPPGEVPYTVYTPDILPYRRDENHQQAASEPL